MLTLALALFQVHRFRRGVGNPSLFFSTLVTSGKTSQACLGSRSPIMLAQADIPYLPNILRTISRYGDIFHIHAVVSGHYLRIYAAPQASA